MSTIIVLKLKKKNSVCEDSKIQKYTFTFKWLTNFYLCHCVQCMCVPFHVPSIFTCFHRNNENEASFYVLPYSSQTHLDSCLYSTPSCSLSSNFTNSYINRCICFLSRHILSLFIISNLKIITLTKCK